MTGVRVPPPSVEKAILVPSALVQKRTCGSMAALFYTHRALGLKPMGGTRLVRGLKTRSL